MNQLEYIFRRISSDFHKRLSLSGDFVKNSAFASAFFSVQELSSKKVLPGKVYEFLLKLEIRVSGFVKRIIKFIYDVLS